MTKNADSLISTEDLARAVGDGQVVVLDATAHGTEPSRNAAAEYAKAHIPGARFLDLGSLKDETSAVPSALPRADQVSDRLAALGVAKDDRFVLYDNSSVKTSARAWFVLKMHGVENVAILDGGLEKWRAEGRRVESGAGAPAPVVASALSGDWSRVRSKADMLTNLDSGAEQVVDARDAGRFTGATVDTVHDLPGGHIPGARNVFFRDLYRGDGTLRPNDELRAAFENAGVDLDRPIVTSCGSGVTASVLLFALDRLGIDTGALYDGSWSEWGADPATPKETGAAR